MSRIGKRPILIPDGVAVEVLAGKFNAKSPKGELSFVFPRGIDAKIVDGKVFLIRSGNDKKSSSEHGLSARIVADYMTDLDKGVKRVLEFTGTGYRAKVESGKLILNMGFSHEISFEIPEGITCAVQKNSIIFEGINREKIGNLVATVREVRPPEVYKGKGIRYQGEIIKRKAGKAAQAVGKAA